jgi:hypothetical protein
MKILFPEAQDWQNRKSWLILVNPLQKAQDFLITFFTNKTSVFRSVRVEPRRRTSFPVDFINDAFSVEIKCALCSAALTVWTKDFSNSWEMEPHFLCIP